MRIMLLSCTRSEDTRLNSSHVKISYAVFCLKKKKGAYRSENPPCRGFWGRGGILRATSERDPVKRWVMMPIRVRFVPFTKIVFLFFNDTAPTEIYPLSLHDALPICGEDGGHGVLPARRHHDLLGRGGQAAAALDRKSTRLNSSHVRISYAVFCL